MWSICYSDDYGVFGSESLCYRRPPRKHHQGSTATQHGAIKRHHSIAIVGRRPGRTAFSTPSSRSNVDSGRARPVAICSSSRGAVAESKGYRFQQWPTAWNPSVRIDGNYGGSAITSSIKSVRAVASERGYCGGDGHNEKSHSSRSRVSVG